MDTMTSLFSHVCGQGRSFWVDGLALPVCERCLGLYVGAAITATWLLLTRVHHQGLARGAALVVQLAVLLAALLGGLHVIDAGPRWRFACGLWTGHVAIVWLLSAAAALRVPPTAARTTERDTTAQSIGVAVALGLLALAWTRVSAFGWWFWTAAAVAGALAVLAAMGVAAAAVAARVLADRASPVDTGQGKAAARCQS